MANFLIIRLSSLGDIIHTLPAFSALRKNFPEAEISWVVEEKGQEILDLVPGIDQIITVRTEGRRVTSKKVWSEIFRLQRELKNKNQVALDFQGLVKSGFLSFLSQAHKRVGFHRKNLKEPLALIFYNSRLEEIPETMHVMSKNLKLLTMIGIHEKRYEFPLVLPENLSETVRARLQEIGYRKAKKLVLLNVGAAWATKRWHPEKWIQLIKIIKKEELFFLLLWGNEEERALAAQVHDKTHIPLSPLFSLKEIMALVKESSLLISGDTFALQAASALSCPVVGLFGPTNPLRNGPYRARDRVAFHAMPCSYCYKRSCSNLKCLSRITPEEVAAMSLDLLEENV